MMIVWKGETHFSDQNIDHLRVYGDDQLASLDDFIKEIEKRWPKERIVLWRHQPSRNVKHDFDSNEVRTEFFARFSFRHGDAASKNPK